MATHSSILAWKIPWTESLTGYSACPTKELDTTEQRSAWVHACMHTHTHTHTHTHIYIYTQQSIIWCSEKGKQFLLFVTTWMDLEDSMPSEIRRHRRTNIVWALHYKELKTVKSTEPKSRTVVTRGCSNGEWEISKVAKFQYCKYSSIYLLHVYMKCSDYKKKIYIFFF